MNMEENYCALVLAILFPKQLTPEMAFGYLEDKNSHRRNRHHNFTDIDTLDMINMKETMTYREIAAAFGCDAKAVFARIKRYRDSIQH